MPTWKIGSRTAPNRVWPKSSFKSERAWAHLLTRNGCVAGHRPSLQLLDRWSNNAGLRRLYIAITGFTARTGKLSRPGTFQGEAVSELRSVLAGI